MVIHEADEDLRPEESVDEEDWDEDVVSVVSCPACGQMIHEDTQQCPHCKEWIIFADHRRPNQLGYWVWIALVVVVIIAFLAFVLG